MERGGVALEQTRTAHSLGAPGPEVLEASSPPAPRILLVGGGEALGRRLLADLLRETNAAVTLTGRSSGPLKAAVRGAGLTAEARLSQLELDLWDSEQVARSLVGVHLVVSAAGPSHEIPTTLAHECMRLGVPYIDLSDDRAFVSRVRAMAEDPTLNRGRTAVATGWGVVPALSAALVHAACEDLDAIDSIEVCLAPGATARSGAEAAALTHAAGQQFKLLRQGLWGTVDGWSEPREFRFPDPVGPRVGHLIDAPDNGLFPELFGARRVEFRLAHPSPRVSRLLSALPWSARRHWAEHGSRWARVLHVALMLPGGGSPAGTGAGGLGVQIEGRYGRRPLTKRISIVASQDAGRMALIPASLLAQRLLDQPGSQRGLLPHDRWIEPAELRAECERRGLQLVIEEE